MSSLLQHRGRIDRDRGVELLFYRVVKGDRWEEFHGPDSYKPSPNATSFTNYAEMIELDHPSGTRSAQPVLYRCWRKPAGVCGCWVVFRYNGDEHVPDLSTPIAVFKLPRDAERLTDEEIASAWFS